VACNEINYVCQLVYEQTEQYPNIATSKNRLIVMMGLSTRCLDAREVEGEGLLTAVAVTSVVDSPVPLGFGATID
jgi:hypothetical protein